ncbi:hypothetical protein [Escherichia coli]|uniref:hypothetical protein n=1 Tax=Escherichia coli TaxID=562 RepID=UPI00336BBBB8
MIYITIFMILPCPVPCSHVFLYVFYIFLFLVLFIMTIYQSSQKLLFSNCYHNNQHRNSLHN